MRNFKKRIIAVATAMALTALATSALAATPRLTIKDSTGNNTVFQVDDAGVITTGSGATATSGIESFVVANDSYVATMSNSSASQSANMTLRRQRASNGVVQAGDRIGQFVFRGYGSSGYANSAAVRATVDSITGANVGGTLYFMTRTSADGAIVERMTVLGNGKVGIGTTTPTALLDVNSNGIRIRTANAPASSSTSCNAGDISWGASYIYVCVATNTWKRAAIGDTW